MSNCKLDDQNQLFISIYPNPTTLIVILQSDKQYDIEVYTLQGKKALTGNTIDMSHLSSATYIVKAFDKIDNEEVSTGCKELNLPRDLKSQNLKKLICQVYNVVS